MSQFRFKAENYLLNRSLNRFSVCTYKMQISMYCDENGHLRTWYIYNAGKP